MSSTLNLKPLVFPKSFDPEVHFALPQIVNNKFELIGDTKGALRLLGPDGVDAKLHNVARVLLQGSARVETTIRAVKEAHQKLQENAIASPTARMEAETALHTFITRVLEKLEKTLSGPFARTYSRNFGRLSPLTSIQDMLTKELRTSSTCAQQEQIAQLSPYCAIMTDKEAAKALKNALARTPHVEKGFMLRMDAEKASIFYLVEAAKRRNDPGEYNVRENTITFYEGTYTLVLTPFDPQHVRFEGTRMNGGKKNEWKHPIFLMDSLREQYGPSISTAPLPPLAQEERPVHNAIDPFAHSLRVNPPIERTLFRKDAPSSPSASILSASQLVAIPFSAPVAARSEKPPVLKDVDSLQNAIDRGICHVGIGPLGVSKALNNHVVTLSITKKGPANFLLRKDATGCLYIDLLYCTAVGEYSENFRYTELEFEITADADGKFSLSDDGLPDKKAWPLRAKEWVSFAQMIEYFTMFCGTPLYASTP